jgi:hypothetical protein
VGQARRAVRAAYQLLIEHGDLPVEREAFGSQLRHGARELAEARGVVDGIPGDPEDRGVLVVRNDASDAARVQRLTRTIPIVTSTASELH